VSLAGDVDSVAIPSVGALLIGIKTFWAHGDYDSILSLATLLSKELLEKERLLQAYVTAATIVKSSSSLIEVQRSPKNC
jgi:hypothetical protein